MEDVKQRGPSHKTGFTLIELLVVIGIIGVLSGIVLTSLKTTRDKAKDSATIQQMREMRTAYHLYYGKYNNWVTNYINGTPYCGAGNLGNGWIDATYGSNKSIQTCLKDAGFYQNITTAPPVESTATGCSTQYNRILIGYCSTNTTKLYLMTNLRTVETPTAAEKTTIKNSLGCTGNIVYWTSETCSGSGLKYYMDTIMAVN